VNRVLITGAAGFIGRHVAREFSKKGWQVIGIGRGDWSDWRDYGLSAWYEAEVTLDTLLKYSAVPDVLVHCAGGASVGFSIEQPSVDFDMTVRTTSNVLEFIRVHSPSTKLVYPSSAAVYGQVKSLPITEDTHLSPVSPYGTHKQLAEALCQLYSHQYNLSVAVVRMFSIYGPELRKQLLWDACQKIDQGNYSFFGTGEEIRDWLHVDDVSKLLFSASQNASIRCPVVNAGNGQGIKVREIVHHLCNQFELGISPIFSTIPKPGDPNVYIADTSKARAWEWQPLINWHEGVAQYVNWYKRCQKLE